MSSFFRVCARSIWRWRQRRGWSPTHGQPSPLGASVRSQCLPRVGPGRCGHSSISRRKPPDQSAAAGRHPLHPVILPTLSQPTESRLSGFPQLPRNKQGNPGGVLIVTWTLTTCLSVHNTWLWQKEMAARNAACTNCTSHIPCHYQQTFSDCEASSSNETVSNTLKDLSVLHHMA